MGDTVTEEEGGPTNPEELASPEERPVNPVGGPPTRVERVDAVTTTCRLVRRHPRYLFCFGIFELKSGVLVQSLFRN